MEFWVALLLFLFCLGGAAIAFFFLKRDNKLRLFCILLFAVAALIFACYIALTLFFVSAVQNQPPAGL